MKRRLLILVALAALSQPAVASACGVERWSVKTVTDGALINLTPERTSIAKLDALPVPAGLGQNAPRLAAEHQVYQLTGTRLVSVKREADEDYHLILRSPAGQTLIAEIPAPGCAQGSSVLAQLAKVRAYFDATFGPASNSFRSINRSILITGIGFFDLPHGQTGVAPNSVELHPVISIRTYP